jgi:elongation factor Ts
MGISAQEVKELREKTGAGLMDCKKALVEADGDQKQAMVVLREKGMAEAEKKRSRTADEGVIAHYIHADNKQAAMVELNCETDFVARNEEFQELGREICMQIVATDPMAVSEDDIPEEVIQQEREIYTEQASEKPEHVVEKIVEGKMEKFFERQCLLHQPYIRDDSKTIKQLVDEMISKLGEKIKVARFARMEVGQMEDDEE